MKLFTTLLLCVVWASAQGAPNHRMEVLEASVNKALGAIAASLEKLERRLEALETDMERRFGGVVRDGTTLRFEGMNVQITNGQPAGERVVTNGLGNLIIGFDDTYRRAQAAATTFHDRDGSHNLIIGPHHAWTSVNSLVLGRENAIGELGQIRGQVKEGMLCTGQRNKCEGPFGGIVGGDNNSVAGGGNSVIIGGDSNRIGGHVLIAEAVIVGGQGNEVSGIVSFGTSILGGVRNRVTGPGGPGVSHVTMVGGKENHATAWETIIVGGHRQEANIQGQSILASAAGGKKQCAAMEPCP